MITDKTKCKDVEKLTYEYLSHENKVIWTFSKTIQDFLLKSLKTEKCKYHILQILNVGAVFLKKLKPMFSEERVHEHLCQFYV